MCVLLNKSLLCSFFLCYQNFMMQLIRTRAVCTCVTSALYSKGHGAVFRFP